MRGAIAVSFLVASLLAGCGGGRPEATPEEGGPAAGLDAALAEARQWSADAQLLWVEGMESPDDADVDEDGEPLGFYEPLWGEQDPAVGDGNVTSWLWGFVSTSKEPPLLVLTRGTKAIGQQPAEDWRLEEDFEGLDGFSPEGLYFDTPALAAVLARDFPGWADGTFAHGGVRWILSSGDDGLVWRVDGELDDGDSGYIRAFFFDGRTGAFLGKSGGDSAVPTLALPTLDLMGCTNFGGVFPVPMADATAALPAGFQPVASPNDPAGGATLYILFLECADSAVDGNATGPVNLAYAELAVVPPDDLRLPGITDYTVPLAIGAGVEAVADRLSEFMLGQAGRSTVTDVTDGSPGPRKARMVVDGVTLDLSGQFASDGTALADGGFALIGVQDGVVRTVVQGFAQGGSASEGTVTQQSTGLPIFEQARPLAVGFTVTGFTLTFTLAKTL